MGFGGGEKTYRMKLTEVVGGTLTILLGQRVINHLRINSA
jgi:hypothetical protein